MEKDSIKAKQMEMIAMEIATTKNLITDLIGVLKEDIVLLHKLMELQD